MDSAAKRDNDTAEALLKGMGLDEHSWIPDPALFDPAAAGICSGPTGAEKTAAVKESEPNSSPDSNSSPNLNPNPNPTRLASRPTRRPLPTQGGSR